jgi:hypothetical protein
MENYLLWKGRRTSFLVVSALLTVEGVDGGELLDAPKFGGGGAQKNQGRIFLQRILHRTNINVCIEGYFC